MYQNCTNTVWRSHFFRAKMDDIALAGTELIYYKQTPLCWHCFKSTSNEINHFYSDNFKYRKTIMHIFRYGLIGPRKKITFDRAIYLHIVYYSCREEKERKREICTCGNFLWVCNNHIIICHVLQIEVMLHLFSSISFVLSTWPVHLFCSVFLCCIKCK